MSRPLQFSLGDTYSAFPDVSIPEWLLAWDDNSWRNDLVARSELELESGIVVTVWVAEENPELREVPDFPRFIVETSDDINDPIVLYSGDDEELAKKFAWGAAGDVEVES